MSSIAFKVENLFADGERLSAIKSWLAESVWTSARYQQNELEQYLRGGETAVCRLEELIATGALEIWDELSADTARSPSIKSWLGLDLPLALSQPRAAVVFDGLSLREMPLLLRLAEESGFKVKTRDLIATCLPTETFDYVEQRVIGSRLGPSQLPGRTELAEKNVKAFYLDQPTSRHTFPVGPSLLIWSAFPDCLFKDHEARTEGLFENFHRNYVPTIWKYALQDIPRGLPIVVTSDHGYIFFGAGMEADRRSEAPDLLGQTRSKQFAPGELMPQWNADLQVLPSSRTAMLRGRLRARPSGTSSRKLYQHGGFSLMEVLVPWIELEPR
jgi:hypothetical protein